MPSPTPPSSWRSKKFIRLIAKSTASAYPEPDMNVSPNPPDRNAPQGGPASGGPKTRRESTSGPAKAGHYRASDRLLQRVAPCLDDSVSDPAARADRIDPGVRSETLDTGGQGAVGAARTERGDDLPRGGGDAIGRVVGVDGGDVSRETGPPVVAGCHLLRPRNRALGGVGLDDDVGDLREHFLFVLERVAVCSRRASEQRDRQALEPRHVFSFRAQCGLRMAT